MAGKSRPDPARSVEEIRAAARLVAPHGGWVPKKAEFDHAKRERLKAIIHLPGEGNLPPEAADDLITASEQAVVELFWARSAPSLKEAEQEYVALAETLQRTAKRWAAVTSNMYLRGAFTAHLEGTAIVGRAGRAQI